MNVGCQFVDGLFSFHLNFSKLKFIDLSPPLFIAECFLKLLLYYYGFCKQIKRK